MQTNNFEKLKSEIKKQLQLIKTHNTQAFLTNIDAINDINGLRQFLGHLEFHELKTHLNTTDTLFHNMNKEVDNYSNDPEHYNPTAEKGLGLNINFWLSFIKHLIRYFFYNEPAPSYKLF